MKSLIAAVAALACTQAFADPDTRITVLKDTTTIIALELTNQTVFCTDRGYGNLQLKVSVPDLDWLAHFDHRVVGESAPCITGGSCFEVQPHDIIDPNQRLTIAPMRVVLTEEITVNRQAQTCERQLTENVTSTIRGKAFTHYRGGNIEPWDFEKCALLLAQP
jgi:hypothetical protein